jgi:hypothetical protein
MTKLHFAYVAAFLGATVGPPVLATVDAYIDYTVVYKEIQTDDYCYRSLPMWAEIGIPTASQMTALVTPTKILKLNSLGSSYIDINEVTKVPGIEAEYGNDTFDEATGVYTYTMKLNLKKHAWAGNSSVAARQTIVNQAKFALLAMNKNLAKVYPGKYKLWFTFPVRFERNCSACSNAVSIHSRKPLDYGFGERTHQRRGQLPLRAAHGAYKAPSSRGLRADLEPKAQKTYLN